MNASVADLMAGTTPVLFDFDGPICSVFAGYPAAIAAREPRELAARLGAKPDRALAREDDPLEILRRAGTIEDARVLAAVEQALIAPEVLAVDSAAPTPFTYNLLSLLHEHARTIGIASNNCDQAISAYLKSTDYRTS